MFTLLGDDGIQSYFDLERALEADLDDDVAFIEPHVRGPDKERPDSEEKGKCRSLNCTSTCRGFPRP
jgi:hypothetical protein